MSARNAAPGRKQPVDTPGLQAAERNVVRLPGRQALQHGALAARVVDVDRVGSAGYHVVELPCPHHVGPREDVLANDTAGLPHTGMHPALHQVGVLETGYGVAPERHELTQLITSESPRSRAAPTERALLPALT